MLRIVVYNPQDEFLFEISPNDVFSASMEERINDQHSLTIVTTANLEKEQRILIRDETERYREFVVTGSDEGKDGNSRRVFKEYRCVWSLQHDLKLVSVEDWYDEEVLVPAASILGKVLNKTKRWGVGNVTNTTVAGAAIYQKSAWDGLSTIVEVWGGEVDADITVDTQGVVSRRVSLYSQMGAHVATRRFDYARDITSIRRKVDEMPVACRIRPLGKSYKTVDDIDVRITVEEVNGGKDYVQNDAMAQVLRMPDGSGGWEYPTIDVENSDIEDEEELLEWGESVLGEYTNPKVTYEASVSQFDAAGTDVKGVELGDVVQVVDREFGAGGVRLEERVIALVIDLLYPDNTQITLGDVSVSYVLSLGGTISKITSRVTDLSAGMSSTREYLDNILDHLNEEINAAGGYTYITSGQGVRTYDKAVSDPLVGAEADSVVEIKGGAIRIANSKTPTGEWEWRTVFVSGHIAADLVTAANITTGHIGNRSGSFWDLDHDVLQIASNSMIGNKTVSDVLETLDATITGIDNDVEYAESQSNTTPPAEDSQDWSTTAPAWREGWYIWQRTKSSITTDVGTTTSYSDPTCISGRDGSDGIGISDTEIRYGISDSASRQPSANSWQESAPTSIENGKWLWVRTVYTYTDGSTKTTYLKSYVGTNGTSISIESRAVSYATSQSGTSAPSSGWQATPPQTAAGEYLWSRTVVSYSDGSDTTTYGVSYHGSDGTSVSILGSYATLEDLEAAHPTGDRGDGYMVSGDLYVWNDTEWENVGTIQGPAGHDGTSVTIGSIQYGTSQSASTQPESWSETVPTSISKGLWLWVRTTYSNGSSATTKSYVGTDGEDGSSVAIRSATKTDGVTTVVLEESDGTTTTTRTLTIADGEDGESGAKGADGSSAYVHTAWANSADGTVDFSKTESAGKRYLGVYADSNQQDSDTPSSYSWSLIKGDDGTSVTITSIEYGTSESAATEPTSYSPTVPTSIPSGTWVWVRTTFSDGSVSVSKSYSGTDGEDGRSVFVQSSSKEGSTTTVVLSDGETTTTITIDDGEDGDNGIDGVNGYVHTAWANSADGRTDFSTSDSAGKAYLGVYTDHTEADSQMPTSYSWSLIKGANGLDGNDGVGISSIVPQYYLSTSSASVTGGSWSNNEPTWVSGKYIWTRSLITWDDGNTQTTSPALAGALNSANQKATDAEKVATNYLTFNSSTGLDVGYSGTNAKTRINSNGMVVYDGDNVSAASFSPSSVRIGPAAKAHITITPTSGINLYDSSNVSRANFNTTAFRLGPADAAHVMITSATGINLYDSTNTSIFFAGKSGSNTIVRVGRSDTTSYGNVITKDNGSIELAKGSTVFAHLGGATQYYSFGSRASGTIGSNSFTVGTGNLASGSNSIALGSNCTTYVKNSIAIGRNCICGSSSDSGASQYCYMAIGDHLISAGNGLVVGEYNVDHRNDSILLVQSFCVGCGSSAGRKDGFYVSADADSYTANTSYAKKHSTISDRRLKNHIDYINPDDASKFIHSLKPVLFAFKDDRIRYLGFYAQDVQESDLWGTGIVRPTKSCEEGIDFDPLTLDYSALIAPLVTYTQSLEKRIEEQQAQIDELKAMVKALIDRA